MQNPTAALLLLSALSLGTARLEAEARWSLRLAPAAVDTSAAYAETFPDTGVTNEVTVDGAVGLAASLERTLGKHFGLEAGLLATRLPATLEIRLPGGVTFSSEDDLQVISPFVMFNWHPRRQGRFSPFLGLGVAFTQFGDLRFFTDESVESNDDFGLLAQAGAELRLGGRIRLFASVLLVDTTYQGQRTDDPDGGIDLDVELRGLRLGLAIALGGTK